MLDFTFNVPADLTKLESDLMDLKAKLDEVKAVIAAEKLEVAEAVAELGAKIDALKQIIEAGQATEDAIVGGLDELKLDVENIFVKEVPADA